MTYIHPLIVQLRLTSWHDNIIQIYRIGLRNLTAVNVHEILEVNIVQFATKALYCNKGAP